MGFPIENGNPSGHCYWEVAKAKVYHTFLRTSDVGLQSAIFSLGIPEIHLC